MDEVKRLGVPTGGGRISPYEPSSVPHNRKISEMDVLLNQMAPPKYEIPQQEPHEKTIEDLEKLIQLRKDGFIDALEFYSLKKVLLEPIRD
jgi:hypothetical protein